MTTKKIEIISRDGDIFTLLIDGVELQFSSAFEAEIRFASISSSELYIVGDPPTSFELSINECIQLINHTDEIINYTIVNNNTLFDITNYQIDSNDSHCYKILNINGSILNVEKKSCSEPDEPVCLLAGSIIKTDQGYVPIEQLSSDIDNSAILSINKN